MGDVRRWQNKQVGAENCYQMGEKSESRSLMAMAARQENCS